MKILVLIESIYDKVESKLTIEGIRCITHGIPNGILRYLTGNSWLICELVRGVNHWTLI